MLKFLGSADACGIIVRSDAKQTARMQPYPPLQTLLAAAGKLRRHDVPVCFYDPALGTTLEECAAELSKLRWNANGLVW